MPNHFRAAAFLIPAAATAALFAQSYSISTVAGQTVIRDGIPASQAFFRNPFAVVADAQGIVYIADNHDNRVRRIGKDGQITTIAGTGISGYSGDGGPAASAKLSDPSSLAIDKAGTALYISDRGNLVVRKVDLKLGIIGTVAGNGKSAAATGNDGRALLAGMSPDSITLDDAGNLYICEYWNHRVRKVDPATGIISAFAGNGSRGYGGDTQNAINATISYPYGVTTDGVNALYIADWGNSLIRRVDLKSNIISTIAGTGYPVAYGDDGPAIQAGLEGPEAVASDAAGNLLIVDNNQLRYYTASNKAINTIAGTGDLGFRGEAGSGAMGAQFAFPTGIAILGNSDYLVADGGNYRVRRITNSNIFTVTGSFALDGATATATVFNNPVGMATDSLGNLLIADTGNNRIRKALASTGIVSTVLGTGVAGWLNGRIGTPRGIAVGANNILYVSDTYSHRILRIDDTGISTIAGTAGKTGFTGDNQLAKSALLSSPTAVRVDAQGNLFFVDSGNYRVRKIDTNGTITTVAGNGFPIYVGDNVAATSAPMTPRDIALDSAGTLYIADGLNGRVRRVTVSNGLISTIAGNGLITLSTGDGGPATKASLLLPTGVALDSASNVFISDYGENTIRRVDARTGVITRIAGTGIGQYQFNGETGSALAINIGPRGISVLADGTILVADTDNDRIRKLTPQVAKTLSISFGDKQSGTVGQRVTLSAAVTDAKNIGVANTTVNFTVVSGSGTLAANSVFTVADGTASVQLTLGPDPGPVAVRADSAGLSPVTFTLTATAPAPPPVPNITSITGLPQSQPPVAVLSTNGLMVITGQNFLSTSTAVTVGDADLVNGSLPRTFQGFCVDVSGTRAPILSVSSKQIIFQSPDVPIGAAATVSVIAGCGTALETASGAGVSLPVKATAAEIFSMQINADGTAQVAAMNYGTQLPAMTAQPGDQVLVYLTGLGATDPAINAGDIVAGDAGVVASLTLQLGSTMIVPDYVGIAKDFPGAPYITSIRENAGVYEILLTIPADTVTGNLPLVVTTADGSSPATAMLMVASGNSLIRSEPMAEEKRRRVKDRN